jgi:Ribbon-helix-helix protein, copG family
MGKYKQNPKYNVVSIRVTDEEKALLEEMTRRDRTNITNLMREAISIYTSAPIVDKTLRT